MSSRVDEFDIRKKNLTEKNSNKIIDIINVVKVFINLFRLSVYVIYIVGAD